MSSKVKAKLEKCRENVVTILKALLEHKDDVDYDFVATATKLQQFFDNELKYSRLKDRLPAQPADGSGPVDKLAAVLAEYEENIKKIVKDKRVKRVMQSTRVRKKLDQLNNSAYRLARNLQAQVVAAENSSSGSDKKSSSKDKKDKDKKSSKDKSGGSGGFTWATLADPEAKKMWDSTFPGEDVMAEWGLFANAISARLSPQSEEMLDQLRYILDNSATGEVSLNRFNEFLKGFGPFSECLEKVNNLLSKPWFHGFLSSEESAKFLELQPSGTFLLRFSKSKPGSFALAYVDKDKNIGHSLIQYTPSGFSIHENSQQTDRNRVFDKLDRLVEHYGFILKTPLDTTLSRQAWFHGDLDKDEAFELLRQKPDGSFLVRFSSKRGLLTITFVSGGQTHHTMIEPGDGGHGWICDGKSYATIEQFLESNQNVFKLPIETLIMGAAEKKSHGLFKSTKSKSKAKVSEQKLIAGSNYAQLPPAGTTLRASQASSSMDDGGSNYGSIPAAAEPSPAPSPIPVRVPSAASIPTSPQRADSQRLSSPPQQPSSTAPPGNYGLFPEPATGGNGSPSVRRVATSSTVVTNHGGAAPSATGNYGVFPDAKPAPSLGVSTGGGAASLGVVTGGGAAPASSAATSAPSSNYGSFPEPKATPSPALGVATGGGAANLGVTTGGGAASAASAPSSNYGSFLDPKPTSPALGVTTGGGAPLGVTTAPTPAPATGNYGVFPEPARHSSPDLGVTTGGGAPSSNYGVFPTAKPAVSSAPSSTSLGVVTGGAAPTAAAASNSNYGVFPDARAFPSPALGVTTGGGMAQSAPPAAAAATNSNYGVFPDAKASTRSLGVVTGGSAAPAPAPAPSPAAAPSSSNYGAIPPPGSGYAAAVSSNPGFAASIAQSSSGTMTASVTTNRLATVRRDEDAGDAFPMLPPPSSSPASVQAPAADGFDAFPSGPAPSQVDGGFSGFPSATPADLAAPVGNDNKRRKKKKRVIVNPLNEVFGYDVPDLDLAPLFLLPEPDPNAPPMYEPEWSPELRAEALFDTMARTGPYRPPEKIIAQQQQQIGQVPVWHPEAYSATDDGLVPSSSHLVLIPHGAAIGAHADGAFPFHPDGGFPTHAGGDGGFPAHPGGDGSFPMAGAGGDAGFPAGPPPPFVVEDDGAFPSASTAPSQHAPVSENYSIIPPSNSPLQVSTNRQPAPAPAPAAAPSSGAAPNSNYGNFALPPAANTGGVTTNRQGSAPQVVTNHQQQQQAAAAPSGHYGAFPTGPVGGAQVATNRAAPADTGNYGSFPIGNAPVATGTSSAPVVVTGSAASAPTGANYGVIPSSAPPAATGTKSAPVITTGGGAPSPNYSAYTPTAAAVVTNPSPSGGANYGAFPVPSSASPVVQPQSASLAPAPSPAVATPDKSSKDKDKKDKKDKDKKDKDKKEKEKKDKKDKKDKDKDKKSKDSGKTAKKSAYATLPTAPPSK